MHECEHKPSGKCSYYRDHGILHERSQTHPLCKKCASLACLTASPKLCQLDRKMFSIIKLIGSSYFTTLCQFQLLLRAFASPKLCQLHRKIISRFYGFTVTIHYYIWHLTSCGLVIWHQVKELVIEDVAPRDGIAPFAQYVPVPAYSFDERESVLSLRQEACPGGLDDVDVIFKVESKKDFNSAH